MLAHRRVHHEALDWARRVASNGGNVSRGTLRAVSNFCDAIERSGIRDRFYRLNLFCGTGLNACLVPLYRGPSFGGTQFGNTVDTHNINFVSGDYVESGATSGGLTGNGSTKYLQTGIAPSAWTGASGGSHLAAYKCTSTNTGALVSSRLQGADSALWQIWELGAGGNAAGGNTGSFGVPGTHNSLIGVTRESGAGPVRAFRNTDFSADNSGGNTPAGISLPVTVFTRNSSTFDTSAYNPSLYTNQRLAAYSVGLHLSNAAVASYNTAMQAFQTALGRNV